MAFQALLFCPDEKTARVTTQVLTELEFSVEASTEPFAAVKKLMGQHFDAIVVDCENEQNASLLFKSARNSSSNQTALAVAVVEGQAGVANAFRIGANLVLTKPINVEQAKSTLRVARGLLRKGTDSGKPATPSPSTAVAPAAPPASAAPSNPVQPSRPVVAATPQPAIPVQPVRQVAPAVPKAMPAVARADGEIAAAAKSDSGPVARPGTASTQATSSGKIPISKPSPLPPRPAGGAMLSATASGKTPIQKAENPAASIPASASGKVPVFQSPKTASFSSSGAASAPAPAKESAMAPVFDEKLPARPRSQKTDEATLRENLFAAPARETAAAPSFSALSGESESSGGSNKAIIGVIIFLVLAIGGFFAYTKLAAGKSGSAAPSSTPQSQPASPDSVPLSSTPGSATPSAIVTAPATGPGTRSESEAPIHSATAAKQVDAQPEPEVVVTHPEQPESRKALTVKTDAAQHTVARQASTAEVIAPPVLGNGDATSATAISGIVESTPT